MNVSIDPSFLKEVALSGWKRLVVALLLVLATLACGFPGAAVPTQTATMPSVPIATTLPPSATPRLVTYLPPTLTAEPPSATPPAQEITRPAGNMIQLKIFLIALDDGGVSGKMIGCNDSVVPITVEAPYTSGVLRAALTKLLSLHDSYYGESGLYNALYQSDLTVGAINLQNGEATIHLEGKLTLGGVCDSPRVQAQLEETALQFATVTKVHIDINGVPLQNLLSGR